jgi:2-C-methyl-D-erythritol 4-phosphate cytidylyltransferase
VQRYVIVAAAGAGHRMGIAIPKQFILLQEKPIVAHTLLNFHKFDSSLKFIVALGNDCRDLWEELAAPYLSYLDIALVDGGNERFYTVKNALAAIEGTDGVVAVHDAVRPFTSHMLMKRCFETAEKESSAIPVIRISDSVRAVLSEGSEWRDRNALRAVQTPQCFKLNLLKRAYEQNYSTLFTDDASVVEHLGVRLTLVDGEKTNIKITTPEDLAISKAWMLYVDSQK